MTRYIETSEATAVIADYFDLICDTEYRFNESDILRRLNNSAVDAVPVRHGKWIDETFEPWGLVHHPFKCNLCGEHAEFASPYCPNCGADMRTEND